MHDIQRNSLSETVLKFHWLVLPILMLHNTGCTDPEILDVQAGRERAIRHFNSLSVQIIPDDRGQVLSLILDAKDIQDEDLAFTNSFPELQYLALNSTNISDAGLKHLSKLKSLEKIYLNNTQISDAGIKHLVELNRLVVIDVTGTRVTAKGIEKLKSLQHLNHLLVDNENIDEEILIELREQFPLCNIVYRN